MISEIAFAPDEEAGVLQCIDVNARTGEAAADSVDCYKVDIIFTVRARRGRATLQSAESPLPPVALTL